MRDRRFTNYWGETPEEQEKHRQYMYNEYDRIAAKSRQTPYSGANNQNSLGQTPNNSSVPAPRAEDTSSEPGWLDKAGYAAKQALQNAEMLNNDKNINNDKYKHAYISCKGAQNGGIGAMTLGAMGLAKEIKDLAQKSWRQYSTDRYNLKKYIETGADSGSDLLADWRGLSSGLKNPDEDCEDLVSKYYKKRF